MLNRRLDGNRSLIKNHVRSGGGGGTPKADDSSDKLIWCDSDKGYVVQDLGK